MRRATARNKFELEALEPRVLMSADVMGPCLPAPDPTAKLDSAEVVEDGVADDLAVDTTLAYDPAAQLDDIFEATSDDSLAEETAESINENRSQIFGPEPVESTSAVPANLSGSVQVVPRASMADQLTQILRGANGPPAEFADALSPFVFSASIGQNDFTLRLNGEYFEVINRRAEVLAFHPV